MKFNTISNAVLLATGASAQFFPNTSTPVTTSSTEQTTSSIPFTATARVTTFFPLTTTAVLTTFHKSSTTSTTSTTSTSSGLSGVATATIPVIGNPDVAFPGPTSSPADPNMQSVLDEHNKLRARCPNTPPLAWSQDLAAHAAVYVNSIIGTSNDPCLKLVHSSHNLLPNLGENLAYGTGGSAGLVDAWFNEYQYYDPSNPGATTPPGTENGHFTQMVWASTTQLGCVAVQCPTPEGFFPISYLNCQYSPPGNVKVAGDNMYSLYAENVFLPTS